MLSKACDHDLQTDGEREIEKEKGVSRIFNQDGAVLTPTPSHRSPNSDHNLMSKKKQIDLDETAKDSKQFPDKTPAKLIRVG